MSCTTPAEQRQTSTYDGALGGPTVRAAREAAFAPTWLTGPKEFKQVALGEEGAVHDPAAPDCFPSAACLRNRCRSPRLLEGNVYLRVRGVLDGVH